MVTSLHFINLLIILMDTIVL